MWRGRLQTEKKEWGSKSSEGIANEGGNKRAKMRGSRGKMKRREDRMGRLREGEVSGGEKKWEETET